MEGAYGQRRQEGFRYDIPRVSPPHACPNHDDANRPPMFGAMVFGNECLPPGFHSRPQYRQSQSQSQSQEKQTSFKCAHYPHCPLSLTAPSPSTIIPLGDPTSIFVD